MSDEMTEQDSMKFFTNGLRKSCSAARELAKECDDQQWNEVAKMLEAMLENGVKLSQMRAMSRVEQLMAANIKMANH